MNDERVNGVELLALYGDDERVGSTFGSRMLSLKNRPKKKKKYFAFKKFPRPPVPPMPHILYGENERMGAFLPGLKKIGKFTSGITTGLARAVGIPQSALNALSRVDPTKKGSKGSNILNTAQDVANVAKSFLPGQNKAGVPVPAEAMKANTKNIVMVAGAGVGVLALVAIIAATRKKRG